MKPEEKKEYIFPQMRVVVLKYQNKLMGCSQTGDPCIDEKLDAEDYPDGEMN